MKKTALLVFYMMLVNMMLAQNNFEGIYKGTINEDVATLTLTAPTANELSGTMVDSRQTYVVKATKTANKIKGTATETSLGIAFDLNGVLQNNVLSMDLSITMFGTTESSHIDFVKEGAKKIEPTVPQYSSKQPLPSGATHDPMVVGKWVQESNYSSGYGDNAFGGMSIQSIIFYADGTIADGGSRAMISGSNYGADSGNSQQQAIKGVSWYTKTQQLYLVATENGKTETVLLGKYYIEKGAMLLTGQNGKKILLQKR
jgi:hypothetical protein